MQIHNAVITGSFSYNGADLSNITSSNAYSASLSIRTTDLESTSSVLVGASSSFSSILTSVSSSQQQISASLLTLTASYNALSASYTALSASYNTASSSFSTRITSDSSSMSSRTTQIENVYATTGSNSFTGVQNFSNTCTPNSFTAGASIYTAGGLQVTQDSYFSSSVFIKGNVTVFGTQSVSYISSSQLDIGTNIITVNTSTPSVRYGGLSVFDSGSTGLTGSIFWDSELNRWIYVNASGSGGGATYGGGMFISGPRNSVGLGCEQGTTACMLLVGQGGDHLTSSMIYHDSSVTCIPGASITSTGAACFAGNVCIGGGLVAQQPSSFCDTVGLFGASPQLYIGATNGASNYTILKWCTTDKSLNIHNQSTGGSTQLVIACNGNVGIKTIATPGYDLEVRGNIGVLSSTSAGLITTSTLCAAGTITGLVRFDGLHSPSLTTYTGPSISACKDDANYTTSLVFKTTDGSGINNTNLRITGAGVACFAGTVCVPTLYTTNCINIGTTTSLGSRLSIQSANDQAGITMFNTFDCNKWSLRTGTTGISNKGFGIVDDICNLTRIQIDGAGNVGIGTLSPSGKLQISNSSTQYAVYTSGGNLELYSPEGNLGYVRLGSAYNLNGIYGSCGLNYIVSGTSSHVFNTTDNNTERFRIFNTGIACFACQVCAPVAIFTGCVGIGITSPTTKLDVYAGADATSNLILWGQTIRNEGNGAATGYGAGLKLKISSDGTPNEVYKWAGVAAVAGTGYSNRTDLALYTNTASTANATEKVRITGDGYVGIGTCAPNEKLTVWTSSTTGLQTALRLNNPFGFNNLNTGTQIVFSQDRSVSEDLKQGIIAVGQADAGTSATSFMAFYTNSSGLGERLRITSIGRVGILTNDPKGLFEVGMTCAKTTFGGLLFNTLSVVDNNWFCFFEPPGNWAGLTTMNWVAPNDFNRSGTAQIRWSYQNCSAALGPTTSIFNDSQNATATFRYAGGYLQACITGAGAGYNVQFTILGARGA